MHNNSHTSTRHTGVAMKLVMEQLDRHPNVDAFEDYMERFEILTMTKKDVEDVNVVAHLLKCIGKVVYSLLKTSS